MVVLIQQFQRKDPDVEQQKLAEQQKVLRILNAIAGWAHWVYCIPRIMLEFVEIQNYLQTCKAPATSSGT